MFVVSSNSASFLFLSISVHVDVKCLLSFLFFENFSIFYP